MRHWRRASAVFVGVIAAAAIVTPAHAESDTDVDGQYGAATFHSVGEHLLVEDYESDGWGTRAQMQVWHHPSGTWQNWSTPCFDDQSTGGADGVADCDYSITDGTLVRIHLWASKGDATTDHHYSPVGAA